MSEQTILESLKKQINDDYGFGYPEGDGFGNQFRLFTQATVSRVAVKMSKQGTPTGSIVARLYTSDGDFASPFAYADTLIAESANALDVSTLSENPADVDFTFNDIDLSPGIYFIVVFSNAINNESGYIRLLMTDNTGPQFGYITIWDSQNSRWQSYYLWD
jgi:hypothetical protein